jgi:hypothetical protein
LIEGEMMKRILILTAIVIVLGAGAFILAQGFLGGFIGKGDMLGINEVPSVSTVANGSFRAEPDPFGTAVNWQLTVLSLEGNITQAHIHIGQEDVNGGIAVWLCGNPPLTPPPGTQLCPTPPFTITGTFGPAGVIGPAAQGIAPGEFAEVVRMMQAGKTYANVHSSMFPGGEVRAQIIREGSDNGQVSFRSGEPVHSGH